MKNGIIYVIITAVLFVTLEPVSKLIAIDVNPYAITFWRFIIGSLILLPPAIIKVKKEKIHIGLKDFGIMTLLGILFICISMIGLQLGVATADSPSIIAIIFSSNSIFTILFAMLILKDKPTRNKIIALILGVIGVIACADFSAGTNVESILLGVFAALTFSLYTVLSQKFTKKFGGVIQSAIAFLMGSIILFIALLALKIDISFAFTPKTLGILVYLGLFVTGIMASLAFFIKPVLTPFVTLIINGIVPELNVYIAAACVVAASYFATYKKN